MGGLGATEPDKIGSTKIKTDATARPTIQDSIEYTKVKANYLKGTVDSFKIKINGDAGILRDLNNRMEKLFIDNGLALPKAKEPLPIGLKP